MTCRPRKHQAQQKWYTQVLYTVIRKKLYLQLCKSMQLEGFHYSIQLILHGVFV